MRRLKLVTLLVGMLAIPAVATAQKAKPDKPAKPAKPDKPAPDDEPTISPDDEPTISPDDEPTISPDDEPTINPEEPMINPNEPVDASALEKGKSRRTWEDIVTVVRKPFLKANRIELIPSWNITLNDNMIRHYAADAQLNYYLTDVLAVGFEAQLFFKDLLEPYDLIGRQYRRLPTLNKYNFGAMVNFHYVPIYGKFAIFNKNIVHWEGLFTAGVGVTQSEILPRDPALPSWTNILITPNVGFTARVFVTKWITFNIGVRDYIFLDKYEATDRTEMDPDVAKENASSQLINHVMFQIGLSFWVPPTFDYTTFR